MFELLRVTLLQLKAIDRCSKGKFYTGMQELNSALVYGPKIVAKPSLIDHSDKIIPLDKIHSQYLGDTYRHNQTVTISLIPKGCQLA